MNHPNPFLGIAGFYELHRLEELIDADACAAPVEEAFSMANQLVVGGQS